MGGALADPPSGCSLLSSAWVDDAGPCGEAENCRLPPIGRGVNMGADATLEPLTSGLSARGERLRLRSESLPSVKPARCGSCAWEVTRLKLGLGETDMARWCCSKAPSTAPDASVKWVGGGVIGEHTRDGTLEQLVGAVVEETEDEGKRLDLLFGGRRLDWPLDGKSVRKLLGSTAALSVLETVSYLSMRSQEVVL